jgi:hypothetical protein
VGQTAIENRATDTQLGANGTRGQRMHTGSLHRQEVPEQKNSSTVIKSRTVAVDGRSRCLKRTERNLRK